MSKILFATYTLRIYNFTNKEKFLLKDINGLDFYDLFLEFVRDLESNPIVTKSDENDLSTTGPKILFRLGRKLNPLSEQRIIHGLFESGLTGRSGTIADVVDKNDVFNLTGNHARMQPLYFYIEIPENSRTAYLILQKESSYGIKTLFTKTIKKFIKKRTSREVTVDVNNLLLPKILEHMLDHGKIKSVKLEQKRPPHELDDMFDENWELTNLKLKSEIVLTNEYGVPMINLLKKIFYRDLHRGAIEINEVESRYKDISFTLDDGHNEKTYYLKKENKTLPDLDITNRVSYVDGELDIDVLKQIAQQEVFDMKRALNINSSVT